MKIKKKRRATMTLYIRNVPIDVHAFFKAWCIKRRVTLTAKIIQMMREVITPPPEKGNKR